jgi:hypothetical protein
VWDRDGKREILDQLAIADPRGISLRGPMREGEPAIVNDTNFGSTGRNPGLPDYSDFIRVRVPALRRATG